MAINLDDRYPGRTNGKTLDYPQGSFKNRTSPTAKDGTYLEQDWANDQLAFFQKLMKDAGLAANGSVDTAQASQYFDALILSMAKNFPQMATFAELDAATADQGPAICTDMEGSAFYKWVETPFFSGYRSGRCGEMPPMFAETLSPWMLEMTGGVWNINDPKHKRIIAWFQEQGKVVTAANWIPGQGMIADLGAGDWKAPDSQNMFWRVKGTDADTANLAGPGVTKGHTTAAHDHTLNASAGLGALDASGPDTIGFGTTGGSQGITRITGSAETAPTHTRVAATILV